MFSIEAIPCLTALPLQACLGLLFSFSAYLRFLSTISLRVGATLVFTCLDFAGVVPLSVFNTAHSASQGKFLFCVQNEVTPPPKGGGAGYHLSWVGRVGSVRSKLGHAGSTRPTLFLAGAGPLPGLQNRTQGHTGPSLVLTVFSWCASFAVVPLTGAPGGS